MQTVKFICLLDTLIYIFQYIESWLGRWQANYDYIHFPNAPSNSRGWKMLHFLLGQFRPIFRDVLLLISGSVLVGGFNPSEKIWSWNWKSSPNRDGHKNIFELPPPVMYNPYVSNPTWFPIPAKPPPGHVRSRTAPVHWLDVARSALVSGPQAKVSWL